MAESIWIKPRKFRHSGGVKRQNNLREHLRFIDFLSPRARVYSIVDSDWSIRFVHLHAAELEAVSIRLVVGGKVIVVENPDAEHSRVNARTQEEDGDEARHLVGKRFRQTFRAAGGDFQSQRGAK